VIVFFTELQFSLLSEEGKVIEEELIPFHRKKHTLLLKPPCILIPMTPRARVAVL
jgi:hypothetical protein